MEQSIFAYLNRLVFSSFMRERKRNRGEVGIETGVCERRGERRFKRVLHVSDLRFFLKV